MARTPRPATPGDRVLWWACVALIGCALPVLGACGRRAGSPCEIEGSGFTARDPCAHKCLERWTVSCPGDNDVRPALCSGGETCEPGTCPRGQACYSFEDPFDEVSYCVPLEVCFESSPLADDLLAWERGSFERSAATRAHFEEKSRQPGERTAPSGSPALR